MNSQPSSVAGFTITELMVVVAIAGALAMIALPSFKSLSQSQEIKDAAIELYSALSLARSEAIKRNCNVTVTPIYNPVNFPAPTHNEVGWTIATGAGCTTAATIRNKSQLKGIALTVLPTTVTSITYQRTGRTTAAISPTFLIDAYGATTPYASCVKIELSGMSRIYKPTGGVCP